MLNRSGLLRRLLADRRAVAAAIVAITLPATLVATGMAADAGLAEIRNSQLQQAADAAAGAGREKYDASLSGHQSAAVNESILYANQNVASSLKASDVEEGWWDITKTPKTFGACVPGQTGDPFCNAIRVTTRLEHRLVFGALLGREKLDLSARAIAYKCSNTDYPYTLVPDDPVPPSKPTVWLSWPADGNGPNQSYYYQNTGGRQNPVIKFYSPTDGEDVSFFVTFSNGTQLQMDTYCKGTFLIVPDAFDWRGVKNITATVQRTSSNNSLDPQYILSDTSKYPSQLAPGGDVYSPTGTTNKLLAALRPEKVHVTPYPSAAGIQYWASEGSPTPDRRTILVK